MAITVEAVYENGVLKPAQPLPLQEHEKVTVTVEPARPPIWERLAALTADAPPEEIAKLPPGGAAEVGRPPLAERIEARARALPPETLDALPPDGASQHDHYLYGTPKRPE